MPTEQGVGGDGGVLRTVAARSNTDAAMPNEGSSVEPYIRLYLGPLPPSRGVHRGPRMSVALQSMQFGAFTRRACPYA